MSAGIQPASTKGDLVELRRYRLRRGAREKMIGLFEREFVEGQEVTGMRVIGQFRDLDDPNSFVWLRGFVDMEARRDSLQAFYTGPIWTKHGGTANDTMINSDNVLLLRSSSPGRGFPPSHETRRPADTLEPGAGLLTATTCYLAPGTATSFAELFETRIRAILTDAGATVRASFIAETSPNTFPRLPVREGETVFVWFSSFADIKAHDSFAVALAQLPVWTEEVFPEIDRRVWRPSEVARLVPTYRSLLHR